MKNMMKLLLLLVVLCGLTGCFQIDQVITLLPDGSGTFEETFMISRKISASMAALTAGLDEQAETDDTRKPDIKEQSFFKDAEIKKRAESLGSGVRFIRMERIVNKQFEGYKAIYSFNDINMLHIEQNNPGMPKQEQVNGTTAKGIAFIFKPGKTAQLTVKQPKKDAMTEVPLAEAAVPAKKTSPEELAMMRQMFDGMRVVTTLVIKGQVLKSNATHRVGSAITLAELDFGRILDKPELLEKMAAMPPGDQAAAMEMLKVFPGMKIDMNNEVQVSFK